MKKIALISVVLSMTAGPALAQNQAALCQLWSAHQNAAGTSAAKGAAYQPGVDVNGRPVVPADGGVAPAITTPDVIRIPVTLELAQQLGATVPAGMTLDAIAGVVNIGRDGAVSYNGQDLTQGAYVLCKGAAKPEVMAPAISETAPAAQAGTLGQLPAAAIPAVAVPAANSSAPAQEAPRVIVPADAPATAAQALEIVTPETQGSAPAAIENHNGSSGAVHTPEPIRESDIIWGAGE